MERTESTCFASLTFFLSSPWVSVCRFFFNFVFYLSSSFLDKKPGSSCADTNSLKCHPSFSPTPEWAVPNPQCVRWAVRRRDGWHFRLAHKNYKKDCGAVCEQSYAARILKVDRHILIRFCATLWPSVSRCPYQVCYTTRCPYQVS